MVRVVKTTTDLSAKHFSRYGEFLASFELSKYGWDTYTPVYDEYVDLIIHKLVCKKCNEPWNTNPKITCSDCKKEITSTNKDKIIANVRCKNCSFIFKKSSICPKCKMTDLENFPTCPFCKKTIVTLEEIGCKNCGGKIHKEKFRTIQIKASRLEPSGRTYAVDLKPRDLSQGDFHAFIWVCIDKRDLPHFLVIPLRNFINESRDFIKSISFLKDQGREHFNSATYGKWARYVDRFDLLE